jgi:hypothetical protein
MFLIEQMAQNPRRANSRKRTTDDDYSFSHIKFLFESGRRNRTGARIEVKLGWGVATPSGVAYL